MASQNQNIIYLFRDGFFYYGSQMSSGIRFVFPQTSVKDLDVFNKQELKEAIYSFITQNQILPGYYLIVLSEHVYFEKDFFNVKEEQQNAALQSYLETVPFENTYIKTFPIENGFKAVVVNKDLCSILQEAFLDKGFTSDGITPAFGLSPDPIHLLFEKYSVLKQNSFLLQNEDVKKNFYSQNVSGQEGDSNKQNKKIIALLAVFILLLTILVIVVINNL